MNNLLKNEQGRSMVEMLGVLAVMGVISIGGLYGYTQAMKRHRANELLNEANKRAVVLAMKIVAGQEVPTEASDGLISEFNNPSGYTFKVLKNPSNSQQFKMEIDGVSQEVCEQMKASVGGPIRGIDCPTGESGTGTLTFNADMSTGDTSSGGSEDNTTCPTGTADTGAGGYAATLSDGTMCYCKTSGTTYQSGSCQTKPESCTSYADCDKGEYCQFSPSGCSGNNITAPTSGTCQPVSACNLYSIGTNYKASNYSGTCKPNWWTTKDICASLGMHMPSLTEVGCEDYKDSTCPKTGTVYGQLKNDADNPLRYSFWTTDMYDSNNLNSCRAWNVDNVGGVDGDGRYIYDDFLCVR